MIQRPTYTILYLYTHASVAYLRQAYERTSVTRHCGRCPYAWLPLWPTYGRPCPCCRRGKWAESPMVCSPGQSDRRERRPRCMPIYLAAATRQWVYHGSSSYHVGVPPYGGGRRCDNQYCSLSHCSLSISLLFVLTTPLGYLPPPSIENRRLFLSFLW